MRLQSLVSVGEFPPFPSTFECVQYNITDFPKERIASVFRVEEKVNEAVSKKQAVCF
jgi:hypothetical protein